MQNSNACQVTFDRLVTVLEKIQNTAAKFDYVSKQFSQFIQPKVDSKVSAKFSFWFEVVIE